jgi:hypothetical protein
MAADHHPRALAAAVLLALFAWTARPLPAAEPEGAQVTILADGTVTVSGGVEIPPYPGSGRWTEGTRRVSARYVVRQFRFLGPAGPPAMELYVTRDLTAAAADGAFEIGMVRGFVTAFSSQAGFVPGQFVVHDATLGGWHVTECRVALSRNERTIWLYAYIFPRQPSLTFLTIREDPTAAAEIATYLTSVRLR